VGGGGSKHVDPHHSPLTTHNSPTVKILDLGLARQVHDDVQLTQQGMIIGTPAFMSPEQANGTPVDARSDLFSLGAVLYRLAADALPFEGENTLALLSAVATHEPVPVAKLNPTLPPALATLIMQLLAKSPGARPASATAVREALECIDCQLAGPTAPVRPGPRRPAQPTPAPAAKLRWWYALPLAVAAFAAIALAAAIGVVAVGAFILTSLTDRRIDPRDANVVYLSDLQPIEVVNWLKQGDFKKKGPPQGDFKKKGPPSEPRGVMVGGQPLPHAVFMHPPTTPVGGVSRLGFALGGNFASFDADVSLNDGPPRSDTPLTFSVFGDGQLLWKSRPVVTQADAQKCSIAVKGVNVLAIQLDCPGFPGGAHAVWIDPRLGK
jgi:hypothetical protein